MTFFGPSGQGYTPASGTNLAGIWRYMNFGSGQTSGSAPVDSWIGYIGGTHPISNTFADLGTTSMSLVAVNGSTGFGYLLGLPNNLVVGDTLWYSMRHYRPTGWLDTSAGGHVKFLRYHTFVTGGGNGGYDDIYLNNNGSYYFIYEGEQNPEDLIGGSTAFAPVTGVWETYDYKVVFDTSPVSTGGLAEISFWKNKTLISHITDRRTLNNSSDYCAEIHDRTYWNNGSPQNQTMYVGRYAVAAKIAGVRDDTSKLTTDAAGTRLIALGF